MDRFKFINWVVRLLSHTCVGIFNNCEDNIIMSKSADSWSNLKMFFFLK